MTMKTLLLRAASIGAIAMALGACTTQSGVTYDIRAVSIPGKADNVFRVSCDGLLGSANSCARAAEEFCRGQGFTPLEMIDRVRSGAPMKDPREITFMCGKPQPVVQATPPAPPPPPQPAPQPVPQRQVLLQGDANFAFDSAALTPDARAQLDRFVDINSGIEFRRVAITGFTDSTGSNTHNLALSASRARNVMNYLRSNGLKAQSFVSEGLGAADPVASNATAEGRAQNRRVEIRIDAK
ncbi:OmpA family protein [Burkholderia cenocepacia]|jgi:outer membrane protein OmpA-like peptidoglycan-associated protein|uniref:Outer membrane protein n=1 Tax=Burkholderia cenocepacia (strain ATCC BAA-245 / DSM 16553 / LMG 16656 / NCTC 13227 / J2315 / CF5610) TaxID=216591 RepID=B4EHQ2_BURCJ|nr:OmpA family protein [Burkholderia cenocepacia]KIS52873.1 ompA family protein [Burkholderia cepacia]EPZ90305.1 OmpA family protein [Burkholderia cenocepacia K56-2Valvano]ERI29569.1 OmpA family protein [Burkholderia cenocepacia BC7]KKI80683.1 membrane protein [Burkholderia cenocepacia]MBR8386304.1 OmpA family protein [Burkholderia cenocepacia]